MLGMYARALPQLQAQGSLSHINEMAAAFGSMEERDQRSFMNQLGRVANGGVQQAEKATEQSLALFGIRFEEVKVEGGEEPKLLLPS